MVHGRSSERGTPSRLRNAAGTVTIMRLTDAHLGMYPDRMSDNTKNPNPRNLGDYEEAG